MSSRKDDILPKYRSTDPSLTDVPKDAFVRVADEKLLMPRDVVSISKASQVAWTQSRDARHSSISSDADAADLRIEMDDADVTRPPHRIDGTRPANYTNDKSASAPNLDATTTPPPSSSDSHSSKSTLKSRNREKSVGICKVCGDVATGKYFGALVCVPCKTFFLRYNGEGFSFVCKNKQACDISVSTRIQCKYCRFQKCLAAGMTRKVRPPQVEPKEGKQLCVVCSDFGNGVHFGVVTCEGCKKFFRRGLVEHKSYVCKFNKCCPINPQTRNTCRYCRYSKCKSLGMSREAIQMGRPSKASQKQGLGRLLERQHADEDDPMDSEEKSFDEFPKPPRALDLSFAQPPTSTCVVSLGSEKRTQDPSSDASPQFASLPPPLLLQCDACLSPNEISDSCVPSFRPSNDDRKIVFTTKNYDNDRNQFNSGRARTSPKRVTMSDLVAAFGAGKIDRVECADKSTFWEDESFGVEDSYNGARGGRGSGYRASAYEGDAFSDVAYRADGDDEDSGIEHKINYLSDVSKNYWLSSLSPDENLHASDERHLDIINRILPNYGEFVSASETINHNLTNNYREWAGKKGHRMNGDVVSEWIKAAVIPAFTIVSVKYCKQIPGFKNFDVADQVKIACLGQSPSRILAALLHWFDPIVNDFKDFLSWRDRIPGNSDRFKRYLIGFANKVQLLKLDPIEAALLNSLVIVATDYPGLIDHQVIESARTQMISTFRAYIAAKYGTSNDRLEKLFGIIPEIRKIGFFHHEMTNRKTMMAEEFGERLLASLDL